MRLDGGATCTEDGCTRTIVVLPERGGRRLPFEVDLVAAEDDVAQNGHVLIRILTTRPPVRILVPSFEVRDELLARCPWRIMRHRCRELRRYSQPSIAFDDATTEAIFDILSGRKAEHHG